MPSHHVVRYRLLGIDDTERLRDIDRSERIEGLFTVHEGALVLRATLEEAPDWSGATRAGYIATLRDVLDTGGCAVGAWDGARLAGFASLRAQGVGGDPAVLQLDMLYVSRGDRGRGIGRELTRRVAGLARDLGATSLYVSATPTVNTVQAYLRMGARLLARPDPELFAKEPDDIHLLLPLAE